MCRSAGRGQSGAGLVLAREQGQDFAGSASPAGGIRQRQVRLDLLAAAAAVFLLDHVTGLAGSVTMP
jgi:hypothetical protein